MSPIFFTCKKCNLIIYVFERVSHKNNFGVPTPSELRVRVTNKCPRCGREFSIPSVNDVIIARKGTVKRKKADN